MKSNYSKQSVSTYLLSLIVLVFTSSCTIYQNVPDNDGIYSSEKKERRVIEVNSQKHRDYENNYFSKEIERLDNINGTDIFIDIERYSSLNDSIPNVTDSISDYNPNSAWGYDNDDVVININYNNGFGWGNNWNLYDPYLSYGFFNPWFGGGWANRWNPGFYYGGFRSFYNPYFNPFGPYHPFYHGLAGYRSARWRYLNGGNGFYNGFNNDFNYGRRSGYASNSTRRVTNTNSRRRVSFSNDNARARNSSRNSNSRRRVTNTRSRDNRNISRRSNNSNSRSSINRSSSRSRPSSSRPSSTGSSSRSSGRSSGSSRGGSSKRGG